MKRAALEPRPVISMRGVSLRYGRFTALDDVALQIPAGRLVGLIGPDGVGKSSLLALAAGARRIQRGLVEVLDGDMSSAAHRRHVCSRIAYMPQGLGRNLYPSLSVAENLQFFARLFGHDRAERHRRIEMLTMSTGLHPFLDRPVSKLSGGMKQKLGICCALIHDPDLLVLDEPTTGVDPLARSQFWRLIAAIRARSERMSVVVATAYMEEARDFDWLIMMDAGRVLIADTPAAILSRSGCSTLEEAFIALLPAQRRAGRGEVPPGWSPPVPLNEIAVEAQGLTMQFGDFLAVDQASFRLRKGEIFGFLGSNGCGKSTTMKMLTGLLLPTAGTVSLFGRALDPRDMDTRRRVGYMSQGFSLYRELTVGQNLLLHARLFHLPQAAIATRVAETANRFGLSGMLDALPGALPLGMRQRLSLAVAMVHRPDLLILDEPTSGVDPMARDLFWDLVANLARHEGVTVFISTHFMNEAERCDRVALMHAGKVLATDTPAGLMRETGSTTLEQAFIRYLGKARHESAADTTAVASAAFPGSSTAAEPARFSLGRMQSYTWRESLELQRDPVRAVLALLGSLVLMCVMGLGINLDVESLTFAVLDRDQTARSRDYVLNIAGSRYFVQQPALGSHAEMDRRMRDGTLSLALEIPADFARDIERRNPVEIGVWVDGSMPLRAETIRGYVEGLHATWLQGALMQLPGAPVAATGEVQTRFRYNPGVRSFPAMVPAIIPMLLLMVPAMLTALTVVRERELGSIVNLYVTPVTRLEFLLGKQLPYVVLALVNFLTMTLLAATAFDVPVKGSFPTLLAAVMIYSIATTGIGLLASALTRSQIAAIFFTTIGTIIPAVQFSGLIHPLTSLAGGGRLIGEIYPATHMFIVSRGVFNKALGYADLHGQFWPLLVSIPVIVGGAALLMRKQET